MSAGQSTRVEPEEGETGSGPDACARPASLDRAAGMPTVGLTQLAEWVESSAAGEQWYVRWSRGPQVDLPADSQGSSRDALTGIALPGLSANPLRIEPWWGDRSVRLWVARRLYDYRHLRERGPHVRPWVLLGEQRGRGPDNEPLVVCHRPVAWVSEDALGESEKIVARQPADEWGPLRRLGGPAD